MFALLIDAIQALQRENKEMLWGSMVKQTMKRKKPAFNEAYYGYRPSRAARGRRQAEDRHAQAGREERDLRHHRPQRRGRARRLKTPESA